mgnify:CR=1 FL=1
MTLLQCVLGLITLLFSAPFTHLVCLAPLQAALMPSTQSGGLELLEQLGFATTASVTAKALSSHQARFKVKPIGDTPTVVV